MTIRHIRAVDTPYAHIINTANSEWYNADTTSFETFNGSNLADYAVAAGSQFGTTGVFPWEFPSGIAAGQYSVFVYDGDDDSLVEAGVVDWTGTALKIEPNLGATAPTDWIKPAAIQDGAFTAAKFASGAFDAVWSVSTRTLSSFGSLVADIYSYFIDGTRADAFKADVSGLSTYDGSDTTGTATLLSRLSSTRAGYLDKLNVSGTIAHSDAAATYQADVSGLSTFDASSDTVTVGTNNDKTGYSLVSTGLDAITAWAVAITGNITGNLSGSVGSVTAAVETDSASRTASKATATEIRNAVGLGSANLDTQLSGIDAAADASAGILATLTENVSGLRFTEKALEEAPTGGSGGDDAATIYSYFADGTRPNIFMATGFATPANVTDARDAVISQGNSAWATATGFIDTTEFEARTLPTAEYATLAGQGVIADAIDELPDSDTIRDGLLRTGVTYRHTNVSTTDTVDVAITEAP